MFTGISTGAEARHTKGIIGWYFQFSFRAIIWEMLTKPWFRSSDCHAPVRKPSGAPFTGGAAYAGNSSCILAGFRLAGIEELHGAAGVCCCPEQCLFVLLENGQPVLQVTGVVLQVSVNRQFGA